MGLNSYMREENIPPMNMTFSQMLCIRTVSSLQHSSNVTPLILFEYTVVTLCYSRSLASTSERRNSQEIK